MVFFRGGGKEGDKNLHLLHCPAVKNTIVVNAGNLLSRWSNARIRSTRHRVIQPPPKPEDMEDADNPDAMFPARYSIAYFCNSNFDKWIEALPGTGEQYEKERCMRGSTVENIWLGG